MSFRSLAMSQIMDLVARAARSSAPVIITGESGTGKELVAQIIHNLSPRSAGPYIPVNCAAIPETLIESELFGHERGAFTGAEQMRQGYFECANGGTLFLDEFIEMKTNVQAKLLRVLEERKLRRIGASREIGLDVRVLAASNRSLRRAISEGWLREDLFYRLNVFSLDLPPLRERIEDLPMLVAKFILEANKEQGRQVQGVSAECLEALKTHRWPGNVRELRNVIDHAVIVSKRRTISLDDLPPQYRSPNGKVEHVTFPVGSSLDEVERELIGRTIEFTAGNKTRAAQMLGVGVRTLYRRLERYAGDEPVSRRNAASIAGRDGWRA
jgi:transcriptional regulator with PAS, ATPase and Fis domain